jgi:YggT family protein
MQNSLIFLFKTLSDLYILAFLLRLILQWTRANFYNPISQVVVRVTNPLVRPLRRIVPAIGKIDTATLLVLLGLECAATWVILRLYGVAPAPLDLLQFTALRVVSLTLWFYSVGLLIYVVLSWVGPRAYNPATAMLTDLLEPILRRARRLLPPIAGLDLSPMLILILIQTIVMALPLPGFLR